jgi:hypothetical protein
VGAVASSVNDLAAARLELSTIGPPAALVLARHGALVARRAFAPHPLAEGWDLLTKTTPQAEA